MKAISEIILITLLLTGPIVRRQEMRVLGKANSIEPDVRFLCTVISVGNGGITVECDTRNRSAECAAESRNPFCIKTTLDIPFIYWPNEWKGGEGLTTLLAGKWQDGKFKADCVQSIDNIRYATWCVPKESQ